MNKKIQTALLSYGMSGTVFHGPFLTAHDGFEIASVWQRNPQQKPNHPHKTVSNFDDILNDETIELVIVNTPNLTHFDFAKKAIKAGKHVVVEKPFTVRSNEADELIKLAKEKNVLLTVYQNRRWDSGFLTLKKILQLKLLGKVVAVEFHYDRFRSTIDQKSWKENPQDGIGVVYNLGSHLIDQVLVLFGMPLWVDARIGIQRPGGMVDDYYDIRFEYDGLIVTLKSSYLVKELGPSYQAHGTEGSYVKYGIDPQEEMLAKGAKPTHSEWAKEPKEAWGILNSIANGTEFRGPYESVAGNYMPFYDQLFEAIRNDGRPPVDPADSRNGIFLIEKCYESSRSRKAIKIS
ncbi:MAG TPA: Gfo/Idh/MocA family oxidoreductase [Chryseosolibacter sp.]